MKCHLIRTGRLNVVASFGTVTFCTWTKNITEVKPATFWRCRMKFQDQRKLWPLASHRATVAGVTTTSIVTKWPSRWVAEDHVSSCRAVASPRVVCCLREGISLGPLTQPGTGVFYIIFVLRLKKTRSRYLFSILNRYKLCFIDSGSEYCRVPNEFRNKKIKLLPKRKTMGRLGISFGVLTLIRSYRFWV